MEGNSEFAMIYWVLMIFNKLYFFIYTLNIYMFYLKH